MNRVTSFWLQKINDQNVYLAAGHEMFKDQQSWSWPRSFKTANTDAIPLVMMVAQGSFKQKLIYLPKRKKQPDGKLSRLYKRACFNLKCL